MKIAIMVSLDEESHKVWRSIPFTERSATVRDLLLNYHRTPPDPKQSIARSFSEPSDDSKAGEKLSSEAASSSYETGASTNRQKNTSTNTATELIKKHLTKASNSARS